MDCGGAPDDNVWELVSGSNVLGEVVLAWKVSCDLQPQWQVALAEVEDDCQDIVMPSGVVPQVNSLLAGVENVGKKLVHLRMEVLHCWFHTEILSMMRRQHVTKPCRRST